VKPFVGVTVIVVWPLSPGFRGIVAGEADRVKFGVPVVAGPRTSSMAWPFGLPHPVTHFETHGVGLSDGVFFGSPRGQYVRLNFGCPRATLAEALRRMQSALAAPAAS